MQDDKIPQGYKDSPLGIIPEKWVVKRLENIADIDKQSLSSNTPEDYEFNYISLSDVDSDDFKVEMTKQVFRTAPSRARRIVSKGDILMSTVRPNLQGFTIIREEVKNLIASTGFSVISSTKCYNEYLFQLIFSESVSRQFHQLLVGTNYPAINSNDVKRMKILFPPLSEQQKIAQILTCWDKAIEKQSQLIDRFEIRKRGLMQQLLTGKKRIKGFDEVWKKVALRELFNRITRKNAEGNTNVVTISAQRGFVRQSDFFTKNVASQKLDDYFIVNKGDFCYNKSYSKGYPWGAIKRLKDFEKAVVTTLYICFEIKDTTLSSGDFFEQYFEANILDKGLTQVAYEGGRAHGLLNVTPTDFFSLKIWVPLCVEQVAIANILSTADSEIQAQKEKLTALKSQKKGLMQQLLTGKKRVVNLIVI